MLPETLQPAADIKTRFDFISRVHIYIHEYVRFADAKASAILAACSFIFTGLLTRADSLGATIGQATGFSFVCVLILFLLTLVGLIFTTWHCIACVAPRLSSKGSGLIYWEQINSTEGYEAEISSLGSEAAIRELAGHVKATAPISTAKYCNVRRAINGLGFTLYCALLTSLLLIYVSMGTSRKTLMPKENERVNAHIMKQLSALSSEVASLKQRIKPKSKN